MPALPRDPTHDLGAALEAWVEDGRAPEQIIARKVTMAAAGAPASPGPATGLICAYPKLANANSTCVAPKK